MDKILLIEDNLEEREEVKKAIEAAIEIYGLTEIVKLEVLENDEKVIDSMFPTDIENIKTNALEDRLSYYLKSQDDIKLIVIDHDLSIYDDDRLSEPVISIASHSVSIPLVRYARISEKPIDNLSDALEAGSEFSIKVNITKRDEAAQRIVNIYDGFKKIKECIKRMSNEERGKGPSKIMGLITGKTSQEDNFWMYVSGAGLLKELIELEKVENERFRGKKDEILLDRLSYVIGYWFYNIILAFPGVILNKIATSSYLNIKIEDLEASKDIFKTAEYIGPFSLSKDFWWKESLDDILDDEEVDTGFDLLIKKGKDIEKQELGYYCIMKKEATSLETSRSLSWLPKGAILSRVNSDLYDQYAPFLGEY